MPILTDTKERTNTCQISILQGAVGVTNPVTSYTTAHVLLQDITEKYQSKFTVYHTLGLPSSLFFGEDPRIFTYTVFAANAPGKKDLFMLQEQLLPTCKVRVSYEGVKREGYILSVTTSLDSGVIFAGTIRFTMFCTTGFNLTQVSSDVSSKIIDSYSYSDLYSTLYPGLRTNLQPIDGYPNARLTVTVPGKTVVYKLFLSRAEETYEARYAVVPRLSRDQVLYLHGILPATFMYEAQILNLGAAAGGITPTTMVKEKIAEGWQHGVAAGEVQSFYNARSQTILNPTDTSYAKLEYDSVVRKGMLTNVNMSLDQENIRIAKLSFGIHFTL